MRRIEISRPASLLLLALQSILAATHDVDIRVDLGNRRNVSKHLYGIFFEEINHAGEGGLYAELVQDRSFDALAYTSGFSESDADVLELTPGVLEKAAARKPKAAPQQPLKALQTGNSTSSKQQFAHENVNFIAQPVSWWPLGFTTTSLTKKHPISVNNPVALNVTALRPGGGLMNSGFWGVPLEAGRAYHFSIYLKGDNHTKIQVLLKSKEGQAVYGEKIIGGGAISSSRWHKFSATIFCNTTDSRGAVVLRFLEPGSLLIDSLSLFPDSNLRKGWQNPFPFRDDLLQLLKGLKPRFLRFPGGCYVEGGDWLKNRFPWKTNLGLYENRTGHLNDIWGYWSTDGLGLYEYMLLADELEAEPIYVVNNGISHQESTAPAEIQPFIDEALEALEFLTGDPNSTWGAVRASMGRKKPWKINYLAVGNEDCGRPYYIEDYNAFYGALKAAHPNITLIANCPMLDAAPTDLWDWHSYDNAWTMFNRRHDFDNVDRSNTPPIFVSEYAVTVDGGWGNLKGAVAEAGFMTGLERNSDIVELASYAPLFVHYENRVWPTNMIVFNNHRAYKTPSYLVQQLFSRFQGVLSAATSVETTLGDLHQDLLAASTTCQDDDCDRVAIKAANYNSYQQLVTIHLTSGNGVAFKDTALLYHVSGIHPEAENSFDDPDNVVLSSDEIQLSGSTISGEFRFQITLPAWSASVLELRKASPPASSDAAAAVLSA